MPTVTVPVTGGVSEVEYLVTGSGPGVVLVHGTGANPEANFGPLIEALQDTFTVVAPFLSGSARTTDPGGPLTVDDLVAQVLAAADDAGLGSYHLAGHSLGATVAAAAAGARPDRVRSLLLHAGWVATDPWLAFQFDLWQRLLRVDPDLLARVVQLTAMGPATLAALGRDGFEETAAGFTELFEAGDMARQAALNMEIDISALLPRITAPALVIAGTHDRIVPPHHQRRLAGLMPRATLLELDCGHGLPFENPQLFVDTALSFLSSGQSEELTESGPMVRSS
ncbi:alpha/beta hydrolase [Streptomyces olivoreticuli]|uniref:alpha/beta fold hydrolase n=1 Tax=Streptomyces olivoreticuli TaxID=68246 RepID=UPI0026597084|nr:alpha/beta hydrolase [Streptomyces olivoreticuli]WKK25790.1 alpha/beta hydrolase [Streptomyces olivoreticuli]